MCLIVSNNLKGSLLKNISEQCIIDAILYINSTILYLKMISSPVNLTNKPHYQNLDALRGVAALMVVFFHFMEAHAENAHEQVINHGYLAVDFFFMLSGFVISYAYDDRWQEMSIATFFKRRLIRLQPMIVIGSLIGALLFYFGDSVAFPLIHEVPLWKMLLIMSIGFTLIPIPTSWDIRGWQEMHPLNGPCWSLFFEYIANILYAFGLRKLTNKMLSVLVLIFALGLIWYCVTSERGDLIGGWSITAEQLQIGFTRLLFPFCAGLLLCRLSKPRPVKNSFLISSFLLIVLLSVPRIGGDEVWKNGLYEAFCLIVMFPAIIYLGACGALVKNTDHSFKKWLGDISYPIYLTHYPFIYVYTGWVADNKPLVPSQAIWYGIITFVVILATAYLSLRLYDEPVRTWLSRKFLAKR